MASGRAADSGQPFAPFVQVTPTPTTAARGGQPPTWTVRPPAWWESHFCMGHAAGKGSEVSGGVSLRQSLCFCRCVRQRARSSGGRGGGLDCTWHLSEPAASSSSRENKNTEEVFVLTSVSFITAQRFHLHSLVSVKPACGKSPLCEHTGPRQWERLLDGVASQLRCLPDPFQEFGGTPVPSIPLTGSATGLGHLKCRQW